MAQHNLSFKRIGRSRSYEEVARRLRQAIIDQDLKPGDKLPSQKELMDMFQVSRFTILGAIRILEQSGLVYTKHGATGGAFVSERNTEAFTESLRVLLGVNEVTLEEIAEFRLIIDGQAAYWAAKRRSREDMRKMEALLDRMKGLLALEGSMEEAAEIDMSFHLAVAEAVHNNLYRALMEAIIECFLKEVDSLVPEEKKHRVYADLSMIFEAIKARKARAAEKAARNHIAHFSELLIGLFREKHLWGSGHSRRWMAERGYEASR